VLTNDWILSCLAARKKQAHERYRSFVQNGRNQPSPWQNLKNQIYPGDDAFVEAMQRRSVCHSHRLAMFAASSRHPTVMVHPGGVPACSIRTNGFSGQACGAGAEAAGKPDTIPWSLCRDAGPCKHPVSISSNATEKTQTISPTGKNRDRETQGDELQEALCPQESGSTG